MDLLFTSIYTMNEAVRAREGTLERYKLQLGTIEPIALKQWLADEEEGFALPFFHKVCASLPCHPRIEPLDLSTEIGGSTSIMLPA